MRLKDNYKHLLRKPLNPNAVIINGKELPFPETVTSRIEDVLE
jgi:hypothetical protein